MKYRFYGDVSSRSTVQNLLHLSQYWARTRIVHNPISCFWMIQCYNTLSSIFSSPIIYLFIAFWVTFCMYFWFPSRVLHISASMRPLSHWAARRAEPKRKAPNWNDPNWFGSDNTPTFLNPLNPELNPICYLLALLGAHYSPHVSRITVKLLTFRLLMSYIYIYIYIWSTHSWCF